MENIAFLVVGVVLTIIGIVNMTGNISTIHSYNRRKVSKEDVPKYGKIIGLGTLIIGVGIIISAILNLLGLAGVAPYILVAAIAIGLAFILYAQFKYNKGIF